VSPTHKPLAWLSGVITTPPMPEGARVQAGSLLRSLQRGDQLGMPHVRAMPSIGAGVLELRITDGTRCDRGAALLSKEDAEDTAGRCRSLQAATRCLHSGSEVTMDSAKKRKLEAAGWQLGDAADFLGLSAAESELVEIKLRLAAAVQQRRADAGLTPAQLAKRLGTSQPRVATMLAAKEVSIDNLVRSLLVLGADATEVAKVLAGVKLQTT
jgi:predicted XRE-type DNA-binding protein